MSPARKGPALAGLALSLAWLAGCHKSRPGSAGGAGDASPPAAGTTATASFAGPTVPAPTRVHVDGTPHTNDVLSAWKAGGLAVDGFTVLEPPPYGGTYCEGGQVAALDTLICEYADDAELGRGAQQLKEDWSHAELHTGVNLRSKRTLLVIVDKTRSDPTGRTISQMVKLFRKL